MQDQISEIIFYIKGTLKNKWIAICIAWFICLVGWVVVLNLPNQYTSEAQVHVDSRSMLRPLLKGLTVQTDVRVFIRIMQQLMFTRENLTQIAELAGMDPGSKSESQKESLIEGLKETIVIAGGDNDLFTISYESTDANKAKAVVNAVLTVFSEQTQKRTLGDADVSLRFLEEQIREYEARLRNAEKARENFKRVNLDLLIEGSSQVGQINAIKTELESSRLLLNEAISRRNVLNAQMQEVLESNEDWGVVGLTQSASPEDARIEALQSRKEELLLKFTSKYPEVIAIDNTIAELEKRKAMEPVDDFNEQSIASALVSPYVQTLKISLNDADAQVASAQSRVNSLTIRSKKIEEGMNSRLTVESDMQALNRGYETIKKNYQMLVASREQAVMSEKADSQAGALTFKIADPPSQPLKPTSPDRPLLLSIVTLAAMVIGFAIAFLLYFIKPTYMGLNQLKTNTGLPVLGGISFLDFNAKAEVNRTNLYYFALFGLLVVYFALLMSQNIDFSTLGI